MRLTHLPIMQCTLVPRLARALVITLAVIALAAAAARAQVVDPNMWTTNGTVYAIETAGNTIYLGGEFTRVGPNTGIGGESRNNIAALDATTGRATAWNPGANGRVLTLAVSGSTVYAGGDFTSIGGQSRNRVAALEATTGLATAWNPGVDNEVMDVAVSGSTVYVGGYFNNVGGQSRSNIAAVDATTGLVTAWNPAATSGGYQGYVSAVAATGSTVYAGGYFSSIGGQSRNFLAALDATTGLATPWNPGANSVVFALEVRDPTLYAAGNFSSIGGKNRSYLAALDVTTGLATAWNPGATAMVTALASSGATIYAGGQFNAIGGVDRTCIAALDVTTGVVAPWDPGADSYVSALAVSGLTLYVGGQFTSIGGLASGGFAAISIPDTPVPTLLARFEAEQERGGIQLRWQFGSPERVASAALERAPDRSGPWMPLTLRSEQTSLATEALDQTVTAGETYYYRLTAILTDGTQIMFAPISAAAALAVKVTGLTGIVPNPASINTRIDFALVRHEQVRISVVDVTGREAAVLTDAPMAPGSYSLAWDGRSGTTRLPAGVYYVRWVTAEGAMSRKLIMLP